MGIFSSYIVALGTMSLLGCGLSESSYHKYNEEKPAVAGEETKAVVCETGIAAFELNIVPGLSSCSSSGCHGASTPIEGELLSSTDQSANRLTLLKYDDSDDGSKLYQYISGETPGHGGGAQSSISAEQTALWKAGELECSP